MMTYNQRHENFKSKLEDNKYIIINSLALLGLLGLCLLLASRAFFDTYIASYIPGAWLYHLAFYYPLVTIMITIVLVLIYGLAFDRMLLDRKITLKILQGSFWISLFSALYEARKTLLIGALQTVGFLALYALITYSIAAISGWDFIGVMFYQVIVSIILFNWMSYRNFGMYVGLMITNNNFASYIYFIILIYLSITLY